MWGGSAGTHDRLSFRCQSVVWFLTQRPGAVPGLVTGYLPEGTGIRIQSGEEIGNRTNRSNSRVFKSEHRACSRNPRKRLFGLNSLILNGLTQLDDFRTRSGKNREYEPNGEREAAKEGEVD